MGSCCEGCKFEFQAKHLIFNGVSPDLFQHIQWSDNRWIFFFYRFFMAAYVSVWFIYAYSTDASAEVPLFLSNWTEGLMVVYFLFAFFVSMHALVTRNRTRDANENTDKLPWYVTLNWLLSAVATTSAFEISMFYAFVIAPGRTLERNLLPVTFHIHAINSILFLIDIFMVAFPVRILHFIYTVLYGLLYTIFLLILHFTGFNSAVYGQLDFANNPGVAAGWTAVAVIVMPIVLHALVFGLYHLRAFIARKTVLKSETSQGGAAAPNNESVELGKVNPSFQ